MSPIEYVLPAAGLGAGLIWILVKLTKEQISDEMSRTLADIRGSLSRLEEADRETYRILLQQRLILERIADTLDSAAHPGTPHPSIRAQNRQKETLDHLLALFDTLPTNPGDKKK